MKSLTIDDIQIGQSASLQKAFTMDEVQTFADVSGDHNPLHLDDDYAKGTLFGRPIVHGALTSALFSAILGQELPGLGSIYVAQEVQFLAPIYIGEEVVAEVKVVEKIKNRLILETKITKPDGTIACQGKSTIIPPKTSVEVVRDYPSRN